MPFDGTTETPAIRRARLIEALRAEMPEGFIWDFRHVAQKTDCGTAGCALGLACLIWPDDDHLPTPGHRATLNSVATFFGVDPITAYMVFFNPYYYGFHDYHQVTPAMVADALEKLG